MNATDLEHLEELKRELEQVLRLLDFERPPQFWIALLLGLALFQTNHVPLFKQAGLMSLVRLARRAWLCSLPRLFSATCGENEFVNLRIKTNPLLHKVKLYLNFS